ncbi:alpha-amylase family glycosyl hydrolase [Sphingosinicella sp. LHD-64]|uniref:alpha-amylase family glycosyl hydrolase n=1 Tax=Sphingosinicella sp. LHD-64 TaxID=3072139 RepID=UPI00280CB8A8|nr:alpha-amylase family glycosyl hydrolase [Sphingosinicella sp. LHD-64]MDQ8756795.1 alpha-amylase family glycosyl hydrolase [Sphingosinicella sp. LHD-64]
MKAWIAAACVALAAAPSGAPAQDQPAPARAAAGDEVFYHIFMRSFRDANGDRQGDLRGLTGRLDYLVSLGVTSILLTPLQPSPFYHNYFATDFEGIDPDFGTMQDYLAFIRAAHQRGLKVYLDQEIQYVAEGHPWLTEARGNPSSPYSRNILWNRPGNLEPEPFLSYPAWEGYDGRYIGIAMVDMRRPEVRRYFERLFLFWLDPHGDGSLRDGVDGFRIDHMMDDLDNKGRLTNLFADFWQPIFRAVRARNPRARIIAEQADWGYGDDWLRRGDADLVFAFPLRGALTHLDKREIVTALGEMARRTPGGRSQILFLENHDTDRFMTLVDSDPARARMGAALSLLLHGEPLLYYGQELGMRGRTREGGFSDGNHVPLREAMRWARDLEAPGSAIWYAGDRPWWTRRYNRSEDGVSVEEQAEAPDSLLNWYRTLLALRARRPELRSGGQRVLCDDETAMLCIVREAGAARTLVLANLGPSPARARLPADLGGGWTDLLHAGEAIEPAALTLAPMEVRILGTR